MNVDLDVSTVTIDGENGIQFTVNIMPGTEIKARGSGPSNSDITELIPGLEVKVNYNPESSVASKIQFRRQGLDDGDEDADEDDVKGIVTSIDTDAHTITLNNENSDEFTFTVMASTEIDNDGPATFGAIEIGLEIEVKFNPQTMEASEIEIAEVEDVDDGGEDNNDAEDDDNKG